MRLTNWKYYSMLQRFSILIIALFCWETAHAQKPFPYGRMDTIKVYEDAVQLTMPWVGGLNLPQFQSIDLNWDGKKDLVVYDSYAYARSIKTFINTGQTGQISYRYASEYVWQFPEGLNLRGFLILRDYNCDGLEDLFTYRAGGLALYKNVGNSTIGHQWQLIYDYIPATIFGGPSGVYCSSTDIPSIEDMDGDGDLDFVSSAVGGTLFYRYKNVSTNCDSLDLVRDDGCWGNFYEANTSDTLVLNSSCKGGKRSGSRHAASTILTVDLNGDDLVEVILGDIESPNLTVAYNTGTIDNAQMTSAEYDFPSNNVPVDVPEFNGAFMVDVNNDNVKDFLVGPHFDFSADTANSWLYLNNGTTNNVDLNLQTKNFLVEDMIDLGSMSYPTFIDVDQDGLTDILSGGIGYYSGYDYLTFQPDYTSSIAYYKNVGDTNFPEFELITRDFNGLSADDRFGLFPTFGDLDNDGDLDMICGTISGRLSYYENTAPIGSTASFQEVDSNYMSISNGSYAAPTLFDLNEDGLLDLVVGVRDGTLSYHENVGTASAAQFNQVPTNDTLGGIEYFNPRKNGFIRVSFATADTTDELYAYVGTQDGNVYIYRDITSNLMPNSEFELYDSLRTGIQLINVDVANINYSDSLEWIAGETGGGLSLWGRSSRYVAPPEDTVGIDENTTSANFVVFPNPASDLVNIRFDEATKSDMLISLFDLSGRLVLQTERTAVQANQTISLNTQAISPGTYLLDIYANNKHQVQKIVLTPF